MRSSRTELDVIRRGGESVVRVRGDVDYRTSPEFRAAILAAIRGGGAGRLTVDLAEAGRIDSSGLACLVEAWQEAKQRTVRFSLAGVSERVQRVFRLARLHEVFGLPKR